MPAYGLPWLPPNSIYFDPSSNTVVVDEARKSLVCVVDMSRRRRFLHCESKSILHALSKDVDANLH